MSMVRVVLQPAFVLHAREYRNTSLLLEVFTRDHGRVGLVARGVRGVRGSRGGRRAQLQPFRELRLSFAGRGELKTLGQLEDAAAPVRLHGENLVLAYYLNELVLKLMQREDPHPEAFVAYGAALLQLGAGQAQRALRLFEHRLLQAIGYGLVLDVDSRGRPLEAAARYDYLPEHGPVPGVADAPAAGACRVSGRCLIALRSGELSPACAVELKPVLRAALQRQLGDAPLKSRAFLHQLRRLGARAREA